MGDYRDQIIIAGDMIDHPVYEQWGSEYHRHKRLGWVSDALWWALGKLGCLRPHMGTVHQWRFAGKVKNPDLLEAIHEAIDIEMVYRHPDDYAVVMGIEDYMTLMNQSRDNMPFVGFQFLAAPFGYRGEIFGIRVHVVNTLSGIAAIPKVVIEKQNVNLPRRANETQEQTTAKPL
jgi:hypothetical protein